MISISIEQQFFGVNFERLQITNTLTQH